MCGEKPASLMMRSASPGSPPRVRGKVDRNLAWNSGFGITPACAGKSLRRSAAQARTWDHPRVCGEKYKALGNSIALPGSPPRVRGKEREGTQIMGVTGITPACAGKRAFWTDSKVDELDHPRVCGEKSPLPAVRAVP